MEHSPLLLKISDNTESIGEETNRTAVPNSLRTRHRTASFGRNQIQETFGEDFEDGQTHLE